MISLLEKIDVRALIADFLTLFLLFTAMTNSLEGSSVTMLNKLICSIDDSVIPNKNSLLKGNFFTSVSIYKEVIVPSANRGSHLTNLA